MRSKDVVIARGSKLVAARVSARASWLAAARASWRVAARPVTVALAALAIAGCGAVRVQPTTPSGSARLASRGKVDSPLTDIRNHLACLRQDHFAVRVVNPTQLQIDGGSTGPTVVFTATPGIAQGKQIEGTSEGAEVIGSALLYPHQATEAQLSKIEDCLSQGVSG